VAGICHPQKKVAFRAAVILPLWLLRSDMTNEPILLPVVPHSEGCEFLSLIEKYRGHQSTLHGRVFTLRDPGAESALRRWTFHICAYVGGGRFISSLRPQDASVDKVRPRLHREVASS
jgi:hypothetical protein